MNWGTLAFCALAIHLAFAPLCLGQEFRHFERTQITRDCGTYSATLLLRRNTTRTVSFGAIDALVDSDGDGICTLADLERALGTHGLAVQTRFSESRTPPSRPAIVRLRNGPDEERFGHFVYVEAAGNAQYRVFYPPLGVVLWSESQLRGLWDGHYVVIVARSSWLASLYLAALVVGVALIACRLLRGARPSRSSK